MKLYKRLIKPILFRFDPETAHKIVLKMLRLPFMDTILKVFFSNRIKHKEFHKFDFKTKNIIGLAAGLDKDAEMIKGLDALGFGFIEIGTITPLEQPGNPKPRLQRLVTDNALLNRMGFNNGGIDKIKKNLKNISKDITVGINIGKNKITPLEEAYHDYVKTYNELYNYGSYFIVNVSSPNTPNLRMLQSKEFLEKILFELVKIRESKSVSKPLFLKIAPDLSFEQIDEIIDLVKKYNLTGIIAVNTTISRNNLNQDSNNIAEKFGPGGLSGKPLKDISTRIIKYIGERKKDKFLLIGVGGISDCNDLQEKLLAGADLIQIYTSFIFEGPSVVKRLNKCL